MIFLYAVLLHASAFVLIFFCRRLRDFSQSLSPTVGLPFSVASATLGFAGSTAFWASFIIALYGVVEVIR